ncbi:MAG: hypothetical protein ACK4S3_02590 [Parvibaculum sp.]
MKVIPETSQRKDWPRLVSQVVKEQGKQIAAVPSRAKLRFIA